MPEGEDRVPDPHAATQEELKERDRMKAYDDEIKYAATQEELKEAVAAVEAYAKNPSNEGQQLRKN